MQKHSETDYMFEKYGVIVAVKNDKFAAIGFNFNYDGDKHFPETTFPGVFLLGEQSISIKTLNTDIDILEWMNLNCFMAQMCSFENSDTGIKGIIGYTKEELKLTQIMFMFK